MQTMHEKDLREESSHQIVVSILVKVLVYFFVITMALLVLFPFYWMINSSLKSLEEYRRSVPDFLAAGSAFL